MDGAGEHVQESLEDHPAAELQHGLSLSRQISHISSVEPAPALLSGQSRDVQGQLVQPSIDDLETPRADDMNAAREATSDRAHAPPHDYFSAAAKSSHSVEPARSGRLSTQVGALAEPSDLPAGDLTSRISVLARDLALQRDAINTGPTTIATGTPADMTTPPVDEAVAPLRLKPQRSLTDHPSITDHSLPARESPEPTSPTSTSSLHVRFHPSGLPLPHAVGGADSRQARTVGNTPIHSPQLFSPQAARPATNLHHLYGSGTYPSPYLHPVQPQVPKETNKVFRDIDTFTGRKTINQYEIQYEIGKGAHGKVKLARSLDTGTYVAIKIVQRFSKRRRLGKGSSREDQVKKEIAILKKALHPNVVSMIEVIDDPAQHKIYLVLEFCEAHDVKWRIPGESEILLMEHRRLQREMGGDNSLDVVAETDRIMRAALKRRERAGRMRRPPLSRINSQDDYCWSLEYAGDSGDEYEDPSPDSASASRVSSHPQSLPTRSDSLQKPFESHQSTPAEGDPFDMQPLGAQAFEQDPALDQPDIPDQPQSWDMRELHNHLREQMAKLDEAAGPDSEDSRARKPSLAESTASHLTEVMEHEIEDEEMRHVPLLTLTESRRAFRDALLGLEYLHYQGIVHRDIKPENLLRKADHSVKISDFGVSYLGKPIREGRESEDASETEGPDHEEDAELAKTVGTPAFYAPELCTLEFTAERPRVTGQIDVWALGVTLYCFLYARLPYQANNEYVMMRKIADDGVFISRKRLKAVKHSASSRPGIQGPLFHSEYHRLPHELAYDDIDDELYDLLRRIFNKDPTKRISVKEIKHHPWVLRDIPNRVAWLDETDPARFTQGKKIEISKEEVADAVIPLKILERAKSVAKKIGASMGLGTGRKRGQSSANSSDVSSTSSAPSHATSHRRRDSMQSDEGSRNGREGTQSSQSQHHDHPLSQSVTASPDASKADMSFDTAIGSNSSSWEQLSQPSQELKRPSLAGRQESVLSTTGSVRTVRQSDVHGFLAEHTVPPQNAPPLPASSPDGHVQHHRDILGTTALGALFGGAGRTIMRTMSRSRRGSDARSSSTPPSPKTGHEPAHLHGEPSIAMSNASAAGQVQQPARQAGTTQSSGSQSPYSSKRNSLATGVSASGLSHAIHEANLARRASPAISLQGGERPAPAEANAEADAETQELRQMLVRRRKLEDAQARERSRPASSLSSLPCPPSPDDEDGMRRGAMEDSPRSSGFLPLSPVHSSSPRPRQQSIMPISSNSSEDRFNSGMSQSTSYPSIPSVVSANSSIVPDFGSTDSLKDDSAHSSEGTASADRAWTRSPSGVMTTPTQPLVLTSSPDGTHEDDASLTDEDDSGEEEFLVMNRAKSRPKASASRHASSSSRSRRQPPPEEHRGSPKITSKHGSEGTPATGEDEG